MVGELLKEEIEKTGHSQRVIAKRTKTPNSELNNVINNKRVMSKRLALELEVIFIKTAEYWLTTQVIAQIKKMKDDDDRF